MSDQYPGAGSYQDRHGKTRWRYRSGKLNRTLPHQPGHPEFEAAYLAAVERRPAPKPATVHRLSTAAAPKSFRAAWRILQNDDEGWKELGPDIAWAQRRIIEAFLQMPVVEGEPITFAEIEVAFLKRRHVKALLARKAATPHAAAHLLRVIRKLVGVGLDQEWIESDPTYRLKYRPAYGGWKAWPDAMLDRFEARWPIGSTPRLVYALALYFGHRRSDITRVRPADFLVDGVTFTQRKTSKELWLPIHPNLKEVLEKADMKRPYVVMTQYGQPFSPKALGMRMQEWTKAAGIPPGHTLHGLRKTLGKALAEGQATTRQLMDVLGHTDIAHAELYSREAEQKRMAKAGMEKLDGWRRKKAGEPPG